MDPIRQRNKRTGQTRVSYDGGKSWELEKPLRTAAPSAGGPSAAQYVGETLQDAGVGAGTGLASDWDDEIVGGLSAIGNAFKNPTAGGATTAQAYRQGRDEYRDVKKAAAERSPVANTVGQVTGGLAQTAAIGGPGGAGLVRAGLRLAGEGAVQGAGASEAEDASGILEDAAGGAGRAVAVGGAARTVLGAAGRTLKKFPQFAERARRAAEKSEVSAAGISPQAAADLPGGVAAQASRQKRLGIGGGLASKDTIYEQATAGRDKVDAARKALASQFSQQGVTIDGAQVATRLRQAARKLPRGAARQQRAFLEAEAQRYEKMGRKNFAFWDNERRGWGANAKFAADSPQELVKQDVHRSLNDVMEDIANQASPGAGKQWRELGQLEHAAILARDGADDRLAREANNRVLSPSDQGVAAIAAAKAGLPAAAAGGLANRVFRGRERSALAGVQRAQEKGYRALSRPATTVGKVLEKASKPAGSAVGRLAARGVENVRRAAEVSDEEAARAHYIESIQNPDYRSEAMK